MSVIFDLLPDIYPQAGAALGFLVSLVGGVGILLGVVAGLVVARVRYRRALLFALWLGAAVSAFQAFLPGFGWMLASRVVEGLSHLAIVVAAPTLIAQLSAVKDRGFTLTLWGTFFGVAFAVLTLFGRPLALSWGVPALFAVHAAYMAGCALVLSASLRSLPEEGAQPRSPCRRCSAITLRFTGHPFSPLRRRVGCSIHSASSPSSLSCRPTSPRHGARSQWPRCRSPVSRCR
ncbi:MFS transporter [Sulfitobacter faviae]|uniref:MFS transporter n=1 Tax=Sulfitobacter faviae TaxID=1775881 RepID=UPI00245904AB|nr:MFS transporter [Sulfitobacter faviae]